LVAGQRGQIPERSRRIQLVELAFGLASEARKGCGMIPAMKPRRSAVSEIDDSHDGFRYE
jgi:hypothetical protein